MDNHVSTNGAPDGSPIVAVVVTDPLNDKVIALICTLTGLNEVFTAFDITKQLRTENPLMSVPHDGGVKEMVLEEFNNTFCDDYERTLTELTVGHSYVYHPDTVSAMTHPLAVQPTAAPVSPTSPTPALSPDTDTDLTVEKRLNIPKPILEKLGLTAGKMVRIETDYSQSVAGVMSITEVTSSPYDTLQVNSDGRLRLNAKMLTSAFGSLPDKYDIEVSANGMNIEVKPK